MAEQIWWGRALWTHGQHLAPGMTCLMQCGLLFQAKPAAQAKLATAAEPSLGNVEAAIRFESSEVVVENLVTPGCAVGNTLEGWMDLFMLPCTLPHVLCCSNSKNKMCDIARLHRPTKRVVTHCCGWLCDLVLLQV